MISYSDYKKAIAMNREKNIEKFIKKELNKLFPQKDIPSPDFITGYFWDDGVNYWKPGYRGKIESKKIIESVKDVYIMGEPYSNLQGWMEGAVETAQKVLQCLNKNSRKCGLKNTREDKIMKKKYSIEEVKKHNKVTDGWMVYENKVYNVTSFIKKHPGALAIKKGLGKDATKIFDAVGHSDRARRIMNKYLIGRLL